MYKVNNADELRRIAKKIRYNAVASIANVGSGHVGSSLSCTDIITVLYFNQMNVKPEDPDWPERDRLVLSKGHACPALYCALAYRGFFEPTELMTLRKFQSRLQGHPDTKRTPGIDACAGSLGQGLSIAVGMALSGKLDNRNYTVYAILGDGEIAEGQVWEAAMSAAHYRLDNLIAFVDCNNLQIDGSTQEVMNSAPLYDKWLAFGWNVLEVDGHDIPALIDAIEKLKGSDNKPSVLLCRTIKGKGVSFMENQAKWHGAIPNAVELETALKELGE